MTKQMIVRLVGAGLGLLVGILILSIGFWKTLLLVALAALGWYLSGPGGLFKRISKWAADKHFPWDKE